ncbi:thioredoxin [Kipferlia bialata]|uniref:Thioredoxin n=1 Tax=Kipferlia bialata TaxID=797122 RepID=A0A391NVD4_9EUKA|nr:thioredoxin [Kipferlia bialata]|eukprot:g8142.t1
MVHEIKDAADFNSFVEKSTEKLLVIDFFATWCPPCKAIAPFFAQLAETHGGKVDFIKVDVDQHGSIAQTYGVKAMPTFVYVKNKQKVGAVQGANQAGIQAALQQHM